MIIYILCSFLGSLLQTCEMCDFPHVKYSSKMFPISKKSDLINQTYFMTIPMQYNTKCIRPARCYATLREVERALDVNNR